MTATAIALLASAATDRKLALEMARHLGLELLTTTDIAAVNSDLKALVVMDGKRLSLQELGAKAPGPVAVDFGAAGMRHRRKGGQNELLGKAVGVLRKPGLTVLDATAGLGRDSFVLADLGCQVRLCERELLIAALLESGLNRAAGGDSWLRDVTQRMRLHIGDARQLTAAQLQTCDVIYLDPMFPQRGKSAAVKKDMALFQRLLAPVGNEEDSERLLQWALSQDVARVVVKRPLKAAYLADRRPSHSISGKAVRFDVHVLRALN
ncbi:class I SAM-dependent methyltransferase [Parahaliea sp. F7430]|uniref:Ribosomal RNA small subunit methyltransferase J n=1 Tax=Sediminihaliea albiluteola TaxID=2758564 RepID=A0A7W2TVL8_9GAMM|nr:class I SAM-dependent methyltransferase [Sediminihaliea albiluteola]MBA6412763.1 class I SAM-dependent methyltransferase [Sediminihaliea albiluteola]